MLEALLDFIEESLFSRIDRILAEEPRRGSAQIRNTLTSDSRLLPDKNPGMAAVSVYW